MLPIQNICIGSVFFIQNHVILAHFRWSRCNFSSVIFTRSSEVFRGHQQWFAYTSWLKRDSDEQLTPLCFARLAASRLMQHGSPNDLDLSSNFEIDLTRSPSMWFKAPWRDKHDVVKIIVLSFVNTKFFRKTNSTQNCIFELRWPLEQKKKWSLNYWSELKFEDTQWNFISEKLSIFFLVCS